MCSWCPKSPGPTGNGAAHDFRVTCAPGSGTAGDCIQRAHDSLCTRSAATGWPLAGAGIAVAAPECLPNCNEADLRKTDLRGPDLAGAFLWLADLREADLGATDLTEADLSEADLRGASLFYRFPGMRSYRTIAHGAMLRGANLAGANLTAADLRGADLAKPTCAKPTLPARPCAERRSLLNRYAGPPTVVARRN